MQADNLLDQPLYYVATGSFGGKSRDAGFHVLNWGCSGQDEKRILFSENVDVDELTDAQRAEQAGVRFDIIPAGFISQRTLTLRLKESRFSLISVDLDEERLRVKETVSESFLIQFKTRRTATRMQYAVLTSKSVFDESFWCSFPTGF